MKIKFSVALLLGALVIYASSARATSVRTGSGYGMASSVLSDGDTTIPGVTGGMEEWFACAPDTGDNPAQGCVGGTYDLILQITNSTYANDSLQLTLPNLTSTLLSGTPAFGILQCDPSFAGTGLNPILCGSGSALLTPSPTAACDSAFPTSAVGGAITLPGSCVVVGATFYFDEQSSNTATASANAVGVTPTASTPEPSSFALFGLALIPLMLFSKRRAQA